MMKRITLITTLFSFLLANQAFADDVVVVELFTSQGCEKCPPANMLMEELNSDSSVLTLSWHVDIWDFMGWQDTLAKPEFSERQKAYNEALGRKGVYTPQAIINGRQEVAGSNRMALYEIINKTAPLNEMPMSVAFEGDWPNLRIRVSGPKSAEGAVIKILWLDSIQKINISAGENAGKTINYVNVVKDVKYFGLFDGEEITLAIDLSDPDRNGADRIAILVQEGKAGPVIGAATIDLDTLPSK